MVGIGWGEITPGGVALGLLIVFGPIIYGTVLTTAANFLLAYQGYEHRIGRANRFWITFIVQVLLLIVLLSMGDDDVMGVLLVAIHVVCFAIQAVSTAILVARCRRRQVAVEPPDKTTASA